MWESNLEPSDLVPFTEQPPSEKKKKKKTSDEDLSEDEVDLTSGELRNEAVDPESSE